MGPERCHEQNANTAHEARREMSDCSEKPESRECIHRATHFHVSRQGHQHGACWFIEKNSKNCSHPKKGFGNVLNLNWNVVTNCVKM